MIRDGWVETPDYLKSLVRIKTLDDLMQAALDKKTVSFSNWRNPIPASWVIFMQGATILGYFKRGLYLYEKTPGKEVLRW